MGTRQEMLISPIEVLGLFTSVAACGVVFLPFAFGTSPLDAVMLRVPGNQGNWWHALVGAPFFLAFPMTWVHLRRLGSGQPFTFASRRLIWTIVCLSVCGTLLVEMPFLLHLAGTKGWPSFSILSLGLGVIFLSVNFLFLRRRAIKPDLGCIAGLNTAYLANAALCLVVYSAATGPLPSRSGWLITMGLVWPMALELSWIFVRSFRPQAGEAQS